MSKDILHIVSCTDDKYAPYCHVLMKSLFINNTNNCIHYHLISSGLSQDTKIQFRQLADFNNQAVSFYEVSESDFQSCPIRPSDHLSVAAYYRLKIPDILPENINKVLYLDCDMVVEGDVASLFSWNLHNKAIGAVFNQSGSDIRHYNRLGYDMHLGQFNSGMMIMNLEIWRKNKISDQVLKFISENPDICLFHDQDGLNVVLKDNKVFLPLKYNVQDQFYLKNPLLDNRMFKELHEAIKDPVIIHYTGPIKPWMGNSWVINKNRYIHYANCKPITERAFIPEALSTRLKKIIRKFFSIIGMLKISDPSSAYRQL